MRIQYSIFDPAGNITALVESAVETEMQPDAARQLMQRHPEVEQVGFVRFDLPEEDGNAGLPDLRMAGGEFCGNASVSAAALYWIRREQSEAAEQHLSGSAGADKTVMLRVSGASDPVRVRLEKEDGSRFRTEICMPPALGTESRTFAFENRRAELPVVRLEGISHIIIEPDSVFYGLHEDPAAAGRAVREWCEDLSADCLGLMFLEGKLPVFRLKPLVYVPAAGTEFWENSCASGSAAAGMYYAEKTASPVHLRLEEPGGELRVKCDPKRGETRLYGTVCLRESLQMDIQVKKG